MNAIRKFSQCLNGAIPIVHTQSKSNLSRETHLIPIEHKGKTTATLFHLDGEWKKTKTSKHPEINPILVLLIQWFSLWIHYSFLTLNTPHSMAVHSNGFVVVDDDILLNSIELNSKHNDFLSLLNCLNVSLNVIVCFFLNLFILFSNEELFIGFLFISMSILYMILNAQIQCGWLFLFFFFAYFGCLKFTSFFFSPDFSYGVCTIK